MTVTFKRVTNSVTEGANCPQGDYRVRLMNLAWDDGANSKYEKTEPDIKWIMAIKAVVDAEDDTEDGDPEDWVSKDLWLYTGQSMGLRRDGSQTKGREAAEAFAGRKFNEDEDIDPTELIGKEAIATVGRSQTNRTKVVRMRRLPKKAEKAAVKPVREDDDDDTDDTAPWEK